jgi:large subunit ribosomal protein L6
MSDISAQATPAVEAVRTSRVGRQPITIPKGVDVKYQDTLLNVKGPKGQLQSKVHAFVNLKIEGSEMVLQPNTAAAKNARGVQAKLYRSITGTMRAQIANMIKGVTDGFELKLLLVGVGYRAQLKGKLLGLSLGYSHPVDFEIPVGITIEVPAQTEIIIKGANKELVGLVAAKIRKLRKPEPYKGKGIRYSDEKITLKETKKK